MFQFQPSSHWNLVCVETLSLWRNLASAFLRICRFHRFPLVGISLLKLLRWNGFKLNKAFLALSKYNSMMD